MNSQRLLFDDLPETEPTRKPRRSRAGTIAAPVTVDMVREAAPQPRTTAAAAGMAALPLSPPAPPPPAPPPPAFEPAALSNAELRALAQALPDQRLAHLLIEAARELKRRAMPDRREDESDSDDSPQGPNPVLLRAVQQVVGELSGDEF